MKPIHVFCIVGFASSTLFSCGSKGDSVTQPTTNEDKSISLKIESGTSLSYKVSPAEMVTYALDVTFRELNPKLTFDFVQTNMDYTKGSVEQNENVRKNSHVYTNEFVNGKTILNDRTNLVLSSEVYRDLVEAGKATINWDGVDTEFKMISNEEYKFEKGNGQVVEKVMHCADDARTQEFWVWKNPELPLIMRTKSNTGASMELSYWYLPGEKP